MSADPLNVALATGVAAAGALIVTGLAYAASRGRLHRADRVGAAAVAVGFSAAYQMLTGGGWHPDRTDSWLPLIAVVVALVGPRVAARLAPESGVGALPRAGVLVAALAAGIGATLLNRTHIGALELATFGALVGTAAGARLPAPEEPQPRRGWRDPRPATWVLGAILVGLVPALVR